MTLHALQRCTRDALLPPPWAAVLDAARTALRAVGADLSPRARRLLARFVASAAGILPIEAALDLQLAQRVVPPLGALSERAAGPRSELLRVLEPHAAALPRTIAALEAERDAWDEHDA